MIYRKVLLMASAMMVFGQSPVSAETLAEALAQAYTSNPDLAAQRAALRAVDEDVATAVSGYRPNVSGQATIDRADSDGGTRATTSKSASATVTQPLFRGFRTVNSVRAADSQVLAQRERLRVSEQDVLLAAVTAYMDVVRDEAVLRLNQNQVEVLQRQLEANRDRFEVGELTRTDVAQSEARLSTAISDRTAAEAALTASREAYRRVVGQLPGTLEATSKLPVLPPTAEEAIAIAQNESPVLLAARYDEQAQRYAVSVNKGAILPSVNASAGVTWRQNGFSRSSFDQEFPGVINDDRDQTDVSIGATLTIPLYQSGAEYAAVRRAQQIQSQRVLEIAATERQVTEATRNAWEQLRTARSTIQSASEAVRANEIALEGVTQEQLVGSRTILEVLDAQQELLNARVSLVRAQRNQYVAAYELLSALGRLTAKDLGLPVEVYDPTEHYERSKGRLFGWD
ncbi:TolC family outer membrane protein [Pedomonas mirosovicensis]|uniref:TolC family outer membrane protein n=1 Tax=Pedomonas mirosovicensis TaxID=2908641 RepID=UPI00216A03DC|nr:TolC family outer membrane protein [Pedomonas mirosovicensis]MCH8685173.1 TolC family outer membrane protein [Pedomonas mirosovicensis]